MSQQSWTDLFGAPPLADLTAVAPSTTEVALIPVSDATRLAFPARTFRSGQIIRVSAWGSVVTGATAVNWTLTPRWGTSNAGTSLGASLAVAKTASVTVPWFLNYMLQIRAVNDFAATSTVVVGGGTLETAGAAREIIPGSTAAVSVDTTTAQGLWFGIVASGADVSATFTPRACVVEVLG